MEKKFETPILFLIFNRPDTTARVLEAIRKVQPKHLFVAADGPRPTKQGEKELCEQTRKLVLNSIDWDCTLKTRFLENNLGCKMAVSSAITWFFENVEEGIILEDDTVPDESFFFYCSELLEKYRNDERIMHIGGVVPWNFSSTDTSYVFSQLVQIWGWATWRRAWKNYDVNIPLLSEVARNNDVHNLFTNRSISNHFLTKYIAVAEGKIDTWDTQWQFTVSVHHGLAILPVRNLVTNIGFDKRATHTKDSFVEQARLPLYSIELPLRHPSYIVVDRKREQYLFRKNVCPTKIKKLFILLRRLMSG